MINVDWSSISRHPWYFMVARRTQIIGRYVAKLLDHLISLGANPEDIHLIGHSLGAHVAGYVGANLRAGKLGRITGRFITKHKSQILSRQSWGLSFSRIGPRVARIQEQRCEQTFGSCGRRIRWLYPHLRRVFGLHGTHLPFRFLPQRWQELPARMFANGCYR